MKKSRVKKLTIEDREKIRVIANTKTLTYDRIGKIFGISKSRVSQIVNDNYKEKEFNGAEE